MKKTYMLAALAATSVAANAAVIIDTIDPAFGVVGANGGTADNGFTFTTGTLGAESALDTIAIATSGADNGATQFTLQLFVDGDSDSSTWGLGALVGTSDAQVLNGSVSTFNFAGVTLSDNTVYAVRYADATGTSAATSFRYFGVSADTAGSKTETGGQIFNGGVAVFDRGAPIEVTTAAVPEPSSAALLGFGGITLLLRRRK